MSVRVWAPVPRLEDALAWEPVISALEAQQPLWQPGTEHLYQAHTFGFLVGEVVRRITRKSLGTFVADEVVAQFGLSSWIGLPHEQQERLARITYALFSVEELTAGLHVSARARQAVCAWARERLFAVERMWRTGGA